MSVAVLIEKHDKWRKGLPGGSPAGVSGGGGGGFSGLDLNLITFDGASVAGASFSNCTFQNANWRSSSFSSCTFSGCDLANLNIDGCNFTNCTFLSCPFPSVEISNTDFTGCTMSSVTFTGGNWYNVKLPETQIDGFKATGLKGERVDFTGCSKENSEMTGCVINAGDSITAPTGSTGLVYSSDSETPFFNDRYILRDGAGKPLFNTYYAVKNHDGSIQYGTTDNEGHTRLYLTGEEAKELVFYIAG